jgi:ABC-2 type transport system permease protein
MNPAGFVAVSWATWRATRRAVFWWSVALAGIVAVTVALWPAFRGASGISQAIDALPQPLIDALGLADFGSPAGFLRGNLYELLVPLLLCIAGAALVNGQTASDEASGRLELFLAQPVTRPGLFIARLVVCLVDIGIITAVTIVAQLLSDNLVSLSIDSGYLIGSALVSGLLGILFGSLAYLVACLRASPTLVLGVSLGLTFAGYLVAALFPISDVLRPWRVISPWNWANGGDPLVNGVDPWRWALLAGIALVLVVIGTAAVNRRDVAAG